MQPTRNPHAHQCPQKLQMSDVHMNSSKLSLPLQVVLVKKEEKEALWNGPQISDKILQTLVLFSIL